MVKKEGETLNTKYHYKLFYDEDEVKRSGLPIHLLQTKKWADFKHGNEWVDDVTITIFNGDEIVAYASCLIRIIGFTYKLMYVPRGPIFKNISNYADINYMIYTLKRVAKSYNCLFVKFDPTHEDGETLIKVANNYDAKWYGYSTSLGEVTQPQNEAIVIDYKPTKKVRQEVRTAKNKAVFTKTGGRELVVDFYEAIRGTETTKSIHLRDIAYFTKFFDVFKENVTITVSYLDVKKRLTQIDESSDEYNYLSKLNCNFLILAGTLTVLNNDVAELLYAGTAVDNNYPIQRYGGAITAWHTTIEQLSPKYDVNLGGIEPTMDGGLYRYKSKFKPTFVKYVGEFDLPINTWLYTLFIFLVNLRKRLKKA